MEGKPAPYSLRFVANSLLGHTPRNECREVVGTSGGEKKAVVSSLLLGAF